MWANEYQNAAMRTNDHRSWKRMSDFFITINFDEIKVPAYFKDICNKKCINYTLDEEGFLIVTDAQGILHYYRKDCIVAFHIEEVHNEE